MREEKASEPSVGVVYSVRAAGWSIGRDQALSALREESGALQTGVRGAASGGVVVQGSEDQAVLLCTLGGTGRPSVGSSPARGLVGSPGL